MNRNITALILIILAVGLYFTVTENMITDAKSVQAVDVQYQTAIKSAEQLIKVRDQVLNDWKNISPDDQERINKMIPNSVDNIRLIIDLNSVALRHGFSLQGIKAAASAPGESAAGTGAKNPSAPNVSFSNNLPGNPANNGNIPAPTLDTVTVSFNVTAPYQQFISFMQDLESNLRIMDISHLTVSAADSGTYNFSVELKTYWLRQQ